VLRIEEARKNEKPESQKTQSDPQELKARHDETLEDSLLPCA
jgi:hypothetical protein